MRREAFTQSAFTRVFFYTETFAHRHLYTWKFACHPVTPHVLAVRHAGSLQRVAREACATRLGAQHAQSLGWAPPNPPNSHLTVRLDVRHARSPQRASKDKHDSQWASDTLDLCTRFACPDKIHMPPQVWTPDTAGIPMGLLAAKPESKFCRTCGRLTGRISAKDRFRWTSSGYSTPATIRKKNARGCRRASRNWSATCPRLSRWCRGSRRFSRGCRRCW